MWFAILITMLAAAGNNIGKVLQKQATRTLPRLTLRQDVLIQYLYSTTWVTGMLVDLLGALLMIVAFAKAPVSVVQPVSAIGLVTLLVFSHFYLKERLTRREWLAAGVAFLGVLGLGASAEPEHLEHPQISTLRITGAFLVLVMLLVAECWWRHSQQPKHPRTAAVAGKQHTIPAAAGSTSSSIDAILCGLEAGACFGLSAAACRTGFILAAKVHAVCVLFGLAASIGLTSSGFVLQTRGLKAGNTVIVCTMAATSSMISGVVAGMVALDEKLPTGHGMKVVRLASWLCILLGVTALAGGTHGLHMLLRMLAACIPSPVLRLLPRPLAVSLNRMHKQIEIEDGLPTTEPDAL